MNEHHYTECITALGAKFLSGATHVQCHRFFEFTKGSYRGESSNGTGMYALAQNLCYSWVLTITHRWVFSCDKNFYHRKNLLKAWILGKDEALKKVEILSLSQESVVTVHSCSITTRARYRTTKWPRRANIFLRLHILKRQAGKPLQLAQGTLINYPELLADKANIHLGEVPGSINTQQFQLMFTFNLLVKTLLSSNSKHTSRNTAIQFTSKLAK